jgi:hypothetical protein
LMFEEALDGILHRYLTCSSKGITGRGDFPS